MAEFEKLKTGEYRCLHCEENVGANWNFSDEMEHGVGKCVDTEDGCRIIRKEIIEPDDYYSLTIEISLVEKNDDLYLEVEANDYTGTFFSEREKVKTAMIDRTMRTLVRRAKTKASQAEQNFKEAIEQYK